MINISIIIYFKLISTNYFYYLAMWNYSTKFINENFVFWKIILYILTLLCQTLKYTCKSFMVKNFFMMFVNFNAISTISKKI